jgi:hypothetical protein
MIFAVLTEIIEIRLFLLIKERGVQKEIKLQGTIFFHCAIVHSRRLIQGSQYNGIK